MKIAGKNIRYYWDIIKLPLFCHPTATILTLIIAYISSFNWVWIIAFSVLLGGLILVPAFIGWTAVKKKEGGLVHAALSGAFFGLIICVIFLVLNIIFAGIGFIFFSEQSSADGMNPEAVNVMPLINQWVYRLITVMFLMAVLMFPFYTGTYTTISVICSVFAGFIAQESMKKSQ